MHSQQQEQHLTVVTQHSQGDRTRVLQSYSLLSLFEPCSAVLAMAAAPATAHDPNSTAAATTRLCWLPPYMQPSQQLFHLNLLL
jgi:hypothetical protein